jgi:sulfite exporter TauE/SafE
MPCGLVYAALGLTLGTGGAAAGAVTMAAFGLGTLPTLLTMGAVALRVGRFAATGWVRRAAGAAIVAFGVLHLAAASAALSARDGAPHACCAGHHGGHRS